MGLINKVVLKCENICLDIPVVSKTELTFKKKFMRSITGDTKEVSSLLGPILVVALWTYFTASVFLGLFDTAVMAMMTSLAIDMDCNGSPQYGPPTFHENVKKIEQKKVIIFCVQALKKIVSMVSEGIQK